MRSVMTQVVALLAMVVETHVGVVQAAPALTTSAASYAGSPVSDAYPPTGKIDTSPASVDSVQFPPESVVGFPGPTPTGLEPAAAQTAALYPYNDGQANQFPLVHPQPFGKGAAEGNFDISKYWGNLSPWYSLRSSDYGLDGASPLAPEGCSITQMHLLYRHGARYPTSGAAPDAFAQKLANATKNEGGFQVSGDLAFLGNWTYKLGAELLTPFGRSQLFMLGVSYREQYGNLLNNFTEMGTLPVFRTQSQDRMVKTANNFAAGFFGVPEYLDQVSIEILVEAPGVNNSGAPYDVCDNANAESKGSIGNTVATEFADNAFNTTITRLQSQVEGITLTPTDTIAMLQLCAYETHALGYSAFCPIFSQEDFLNLEYYYDLLFYYNNGPGSPVSAAQGKGYLDEYIARFTGQYPPPNSGLNETFDNTTTFFPLNQSIYADATHEVVVMDALMAFNLTALFDGPPLSVSGNQRRNSFGASRIVPFATHFTTQVLSCPAREVEKQIRFIVNDAVIPIDNYPNCPSDPDGLCGFENVVDVLKQRSAHIDFDYDCFANYTAEAGVDYNGRAPRDGDESD
ncbi:phosphoglycerate mutase-like protein [Massarina eburnea CBS 473.64]|uniref:3-phytase n=1 Tax=Massarina eburnea CBS 473.64 TaxID=1395130 RepID=A0A6A6SA53_9PLEO|nr:phosphoglycerate mutase-like protein [Massarina eburnea CBS 473.64]